MAETKYGRIVTELNQLKKYLQDDDQYVKITIIHNRLLKTIVNLMVHPKGILSAAETKAALDTAIRDGINELTKAYSEIGQCIPYLSDDIRSIIDQIPSKEDKPMEEVKPLIDPHAKRIKDEIDIKLNALVPYSILLSMKSTDNMSA